MILGLYLAAAAGALAPSAASSVNAFDFSVCVSAKNPDDVQLVKLFLSYSKEFSRAREGKVGCDMNVALGRATGFTADVWRPGAKEPLFSVETRSLWSWSGAMEDLSSRIAHKFLENPALLASLATPETVAERAPEPAAKAPLSLALPDDEPAYGLPAHDHDFAVVLGVEHYLNVPDAKFAARDAEGVYKHVRALGVPSRNVVFLENEKAGLASIEKYLEEWLPRRIKEDSRVYFFFSGHGAPDPAGKSAYLLPWDGDPNFLKKTGLSLERLYSDLDALGAKEAFVAMDACFSGIGPRSVIASNLRPLVSKVETPAPHGRELTVLTAASPTEVSVSLDQPQHGAFTYFLLKGLNGGAADASGHVTAAGLESYLAPKIEDVARRFDRDQTPQLWPSDSRLVLR